jgi:hypothetical protein
MALKLKPGVTLTGLQPQMALAAPIIADVYAVLGVDAVITSSNDGEHMAGSKHYEGLALDFRTRELSADDQQALLAMVREALGTDPANPGEFDVVLEATHLHVEYDPELPPTAVA